LQDPQKFTQIWIFGLKTNHLATLLLRFQKLSFAFLLIAGCNVTFGEALGVFSNKNVDKMFLGLFYVRILIS
jgi:hypothetical protein